MKLPTARCLRVPSKVAGLSAAQSALRYALCALIVLLASSVQSQPAEPTSELVAKIQHHYDETQSLSADFVQKTRSKAASLGTSARGKLYFLKPSAIRWDYDEPKQQFVINKNEAWLYVPEEKTIYLYDSEQIISSPVVLSIFSGLGKLSEMFNIMQLPSDPGPPSLYRLELLPREPDSPVSRVTLWIASESYRVVRIQTEDPLGNINEISFTGIQVNPRLEPSWFAMNVPEGVAVERQEAMPLK